MPGCTISSPFSFWIFLPDSRTSKAIAFARLVDVVFRFILYATKKSRAPITVAPLLALKIAFPKSGAHSLKRIFLENPSYSPARIIERFLRSGFF